MNRKEKKIRGKEINVIELDKRVGEGRERTLSKRKGRKVCSIF